MAETKETAYLNADMSIYDVKNNVLKLADLVIHQFEFAIENLDSGDTEIIRKVHDLSDQITRLQSYINQKSISHLAQQRLQPFECRVLLTTLKITHELALINDQVKTIVKRIEIYIKQNTKQTSWGTPYIVRCASLALDAMNKTMSSLSLLDISKAHQTIQSYEHITEEYNCITIRLINHMTNGPRSISVALDILYVAKAIERAANHAKSISQHIIVIIKEYEKLSHEQTKNLVEVAG